MYRADREKARPVLLDILNDREGRRVKWSKGKDSKDIGWGRELSWCEGGAVIGYIAAEAHWPEFLPGLIKILSSDQCGPNWGPRYGIVRVIGQLGKQNPEAAEAVRNILNQKNGPEHGDTLIVAALAAGLLGDTASIPALREYLAGEYWPLKQNAAISLGKLGDKNIIPRMLEWLKTPFDENYRGYAAEALGDLYAVEAKTYLQNAKAAEPVPWVRQKIEAALAKIESGRVQ
jgi:HEAT repeat protein